MTAIPISMYAALNFIFPFSFPEHLSQSTGEVIALEKNFKRLNVCVKLIIIIPGQLRSSISD